MSWLRYFRRTKWDSERREEIESYVQIETDENIARGMPVEEARFAAQRKFGNATLVREEIYRLNLSSFWIRSSAQRATPSAHCATIRPLQWSGPGQKKKPLHWAHRSQLKHEQDSTASGAGCVSCDILPCGLFMDVVSDCPSRTPFSPAPARVARATVFFAAWACTVYHDPDGPWERIHVAFQR
jgi:hypothetical protein